MADATLEAVIQIRDEFTARMNRVRRSFVADVDSMTRASATSTMQVERHVSGMAETVQRSGSQVARGLRAAASGFTAITAAGAAAEKSLLGVAASLAGAFAAGGLIGLGITAIGTVIGVLIGKMKEAEAAERSWREERERALKSIEDRIASLRKENAELERRIVLIQRLGREPSDTELSAFAITGEISDLESVLEGTSAALRSVQSEEAKKFFTDLFMDTHNLLTLRREELRLLEERKKAEEAQRIALESQKRLQERINDALEKAKELTLAQREARLAREVEAGMAFILANEPETRLEETRRLFAANQAANRRAMEDLERRQFFLDSAAEAFRDVFGRGPGEEREPAGENALQSRIRLIREETELMRLGRLEAEQRRVATEVEVALQRKLTDEERASLDLVIQQADAAARRRQILEDIGEAVGRGFESALDSVLGVTDAIRRLEEEGKRAQAILLQIFQDIQRALVRRFIVEPIIGAIAGSSTATTTSALGNAFRDGRVLPFQRGGIIDRPTLFPLGLAGESGPEAILPLRRGPGGRLGVEARSGGTVSVGPITIQVGGGGDLSAEAVAEVAKQAIVRHLLASGAFRRSVAARVRKTL